MVDLFIKSIVQQKYTNGRNNKESTEEKYY